MIQVEVIYATLEAQVPVEVSLPEGAFLTAAIDVSKITERYPDILKHPLVIGVFGEIIHDPDRFVLQDGDRVEVYRPLLIDPKEARRNRVVNNSVVSGAGKKD